MALEFLPNHLKSFVEREIESGRYESEEQVIAAALERLAIDEGPTMTIAEAVAESLAELERGETIEYTSDFLSQSAERAIANSRRGHRVSDDVKY